MTLEEAVRRIDGELYGAVAAANEVRLLKEGLPDALVPGWLVELLTRHKLSGCCFSLGEEDDDSGLGAEVIWKTPEDMVAEARDYYPGISVVDLGFLPIGSCAIGSGDPYMLDLRRASSDPPVVRVPHESAVQEPYPLEDIELVCPSLSEFFRRAKVD